MWLILMKTMLAYNALEFWVQFCNLYLLKKILGNVVLRCWRCDIIVFALPLKSCCLLVVHMSGLPFPNLKLTCMPPRAKYEWKNILPCLHFCWVFSNVNSLECVVKSWLIIPSLNFVCIHQHNSPAFHKIHIKPLSFLVPTLILFTK
jgi:hypothetical protein